jgi:hypothetical protein
MKAQILTATAIVTSFTVFAPAKAADQQLLNLLMPDAKVVAGVNVDQAKSSPLGQYVLLQMQSQDQHMREMAQQTGFDPTRDVHELLVASSGAPGKETGLALARGNFNITGVTDAASQHGGFVENYGGATIVEDPHKTIGIAFVNSTLVVAGDLANVKAAIDRQTSPSILPASLLTQINDWSNSQDAWIISAVPPSSLAPRANAPKVPGLGPGQDAFQNIQQAAAGVRFGSIITLKVQGQTDGSQSAQQMSDALKLLASLGQMQSNGDPTVAALMQALTIGSQGNLVNVGISMPSDQFIKLVQPKRTNAPQQRRPVRKQQP